MPAKFTLGRVVITRNALDTLPSADVHEALARHAAGDWGDVCDEDRQENEFSLDKHLRLLSVYHTTETPPRKLWIITEAARSATSDVSRFTAPVM